MQRVTPNVLYYIGRTFFFIIFKLLFGFRAYGRDNIPKQLGFIIASNHESNLDPIAVSIASPRMINFMAKEELFRNKFFAFILRNVNAFAVKRAGIDLGSIKEAVRRLKSGGGLLLFPQGGRKQGLDLDDVRAGVGLLALKAGVPIVPAFIVGSSSVLPKGGRRPRKARVSVYFGPAILPDASQGYEEIVKEVMLAISRLARPIK